MILLTMLLRSTGPAGDRWPLPRTVAGRTLVTATIVTYGVPMRQSLDPDMFATCTTDRPPIRIGDKWTAKLIACLRDGPRRFSELQVPLRGITPKVPTQHMGAS